MAETHTATLAVEDDKLRPNLTPRSRALAIHLMLIVNNASARGGLGTSREHRGQHRKVHTNNLVERRPTYVRMGNASPQRYSRPVGLPTDFAMARE